MKSLLLHYQAPLFRVPSDPATGFDLASFEQECRNQGIWGASDIRLRVAVATPSFLVLPQEMPDRESWAFHFGSCEGLNLHRLPLGDGRQVMLFPLSPAMEEACQRCLPDGRFLPDAYLMVRHLLSDTRSGARLLVRMDEEHIEVFLSKEQLLFANFFRVNDLEEARYFVLAARETFHQDTPECLIYGDTGQEEALETLLTPYFPSLRRYSFFDQLPSLIEDCPPDVL